MKPRLGADEPPPLLSLPSSTGDGVMRGGFYEGIENEN